MFSVCSWGPFELSPVLSLCDCVTVFQVRTWVRFVHIVPLPTDPPTQTGYLYPLATLLTSIANQKITTWQHGNVYAISTSTWNQETCQTDFGSHMSEVVDRSKTIEKHQDVKQKVQWNARCTLAHERDPSRGSLIGRHSDGDARTGAFLSGVRWVSQC